MKIGAEIFKNLIFRSFGHINVHENRIMYAPTSTTLQFSRNFGIAPVWTTD